MHQESIRRNIAAVPDGGRALLKSAGDDSGDMPGDVVQDNVRESALSRPNVDRLRAARQCTAGYPGRIEPARTHETIEVTSVDDRARALLDLVVGGNQAAYEELYRLLSRRVYAFVRRMIENAESADEIMMDTMYEVWRTAGRYRGGSRVITWIVGIARNKVLMAMRSRPKARFVDIDDFADIIDSEVPDGLALLAQKRTREMLQRCIGRLSAKHRECIHLTHFEDMSMREIAETLCIPEGTVKSRLSQARAQLAVNISAVILRAGMCPSRHGPSFR